eukprot:c19105_g2_i1.p1 GENE.c19105_g2_i1~~c19105_g2_i1.p1  ORF type:complete len:511 (+),score=148.54 c19105_g2_i1:27-1535(+)
MKGLLVLITLSFSPCLCSLPSFAYLKLSSPIDNTFVVDVALFSSSIPTSADSIDYPLVIGDPDIGCSDFKNNITNALVLIKRGNCSFTEKTHFAIEAGAKAIIVINTDDNLVSMDGSLPEKDQPIWSVLISSSDGSKIVSTMNNTTRGTIFSPNGRLISMIGLWIMAVGTVVFGSLWGTPTKKNRDNDKNENESAVTNSQRENDLHVEEVDVTSSAAISFIFFASIALVLLFFFMSSLIIVVIILFCIGSMSGIFHCLHFLSLRIFRFSRTSFFMKKITFKWFGEWSYLSLLLIFPSVSIGVWFFVCRQESYAWVLQDFMGICMCLLFLKTFRFPNIKVSAILLSLAFIYDIFWVFISPYIFQESVMVKVATGGGGNEMIPMLLKFPNFCEKCSSGLLGLGDIVLPGLLVSFTHKFDCMKGLKLFRGYFVYNVIGYGIGLIITYTALLLMEEGQPALLYLVPLTLGTTLLLALYRGHVNEIWNGVKSDLQQVLLHQSTNEPS